MKDFKLERNLGVAQNKDEVNRLVRAVNVEVMKEPGTIQDLNYEGFVHFLLQFAYWYFPNSKEDAKAVFLVENLFNYMSSTPKWTELGLHMSKVETTTRKEVELMRRLEEKHLKDGEAVPLNHKRIEEKQEFVEYGVPDVIPIPAHKKLCIELMDEIVYKALGVHFLEPIQKERTVVKVVPKIQSVRKAV